MKGFLHRRVLVVIRHQSVSVRRLEVWNLGKISCDSEDVGGNLGSGGSYRS